MNGMMLFGALAVAFLAQTVAAISLNSILWRFRKSAAKLQAALYREIAAKDGLIATLQRKAEVQQRLIDMMERRDK